jgi:hypothetical protein
LKIIYTFAGQKMQEIEAVTRTVINPAIAAKWNF